MHKWASIYGMIFAMFISQNMAREPTVYIFLEKNILENTYKRQKRFIFV